MEPTEGLSPREAIALGLIQGPAELLPISSSSHTALVPWLGRWRCAELDARERRAFEVALHGGAAVALMLAFWREAAGQPASLRSLLRRGAPWRARGNPGAAADAAGRGGRPRLVALLPAVVVPVTAGFLFEETIDRRLSGPAPTAVGLAAGAAAMVWSERRAA
ncbi:MAG: undecaprenyl-diphosphate phosphatase, partial [Acidobacteriota bacterium]|nr:undecaprenyl-diphosphate phosphatase [Acidobacteriota bacterium]